MNKSTHKKTWQIILAFYTSGIFAILYLAYSKGIPSFVAIIPNYDLFAHFFLYGIWSTLVYLAFSKKLSGPLILSLLTITEELLQMTSPNRTFSLLDLFFSLLGIWMAIFLFLFIRKIKK